MDSSYGGASDICDDDPPSRHPLAGDNVFLQVQRGREWRSYAESMPANCTRQDGAQGLYLVRHSPAAYYTSIRARCQDWQVPLGTMKIGSLQDDLSVRTLPAYSFASPSACNDMHGSVSCPDDHVAVGDAWMARWMPSILTGPDFRTGRLAVIVTWDEGFPKR